MQLVMHSCILFISYMASQYIVVGDMQTGQLMSLITYALQILMNLMMFSMIFVVLTISATSAKRIVEILDEVSDLDNPKMKLNGTNKPLSLLLVGPTGVGKTETVKLVANSLSKKSKLVRLDMSEYNLETAVNKLIGTSAGYVGYEDECVFKQIKLNPYSVILVDELEKAHPKVLNLFLQILDEGFITDSKGEKIFFENTLIFMTSNVVNNNKMGFNNLINNSLEEVLNKEIIGRFDDIITFDFIDLKTVKEYLKKLKINDDSNIEKIIKESEFAKYGLRNVKNIVTKYQKLQIN